MGKKGFTPRNKGVYKINGEQMQWLIDHFADEDNFILADTLGISETTMHRYARLHGLKKSKVYMKRCQREAADAAKYSNEISGRYKRLSEYMKAKGMSEKFKACAFTKEDNGWTRYPEKMRAGKKAAGITLRQIWEAERRRIRAGLPQLTNLRATALNGKETRLMNQRRWYLRKRGYRIEGRTAYWDENTQRATILEKKDTMFKYRMAI